MKKRFRKITTLLLTLALVCSLLPGTALGADRTVNTSISAASQDKTLRILAVGNSFSVDSLQYLYQMGKVLDMTWSLATCTTKRAVWPSTGTG